MSDRSLFTRVSVIVLVVAALVAGAVVDRRPRATRGQVSPPVTDTGNSAVVPLTAPDSSDAVSVAAAASPLDALSSTWYCAGGPSIAGAGQTSLVLSNRAPLATTVRLTAYGSGVALRRSTVSVAAGGRLVVDLATLVKARTTGVVLESSGGGLTAVERTSTDTGSFVTACTTRAAEQWYFADGSTDRGATAVLSLFNPFADPVTADISFIRPDGFRQPLALSGVPIPAGSVLRLDIAASQDRQPSIATIITTRTGRLVAALTQTYDGTGHAGTNALPPSGASTTLGMSRAVAAFAFPVGLVSEGLGARLVIANPGRVDSTVRVVLTPVDPALHGQPTPIVVKVPATSAVTLRSDKELRQVPPGFAFTVRGTVTAGGPVVASLTLDGAEPYRGHGTTTVQASPTSSTDWVLPPGLGKASTETLAVASAGGVARVTLVAVDGGRRLPLGAGAVVRVPAGGIGAFDLAKLLVGHRGATVLVHADVPVVVGRLQTGPDHEGLVASTAFPVIGALRLLAP